MSIRYNIVANYVGQGYTALIGIVITPFYLQYLGAEAYGLLGFFALMQAWLHLLDMGLNPTLARQAAYARGQENGFCFFKRLLKSFELIFFILAILVSTSVYYSSRWIAINWIKTETLDLDTLQYCIILMGLMIALRWFAGLYRSGINGIEDQVWLNIINVIIVSLKFIGALILLAFFTQDIKIFFEYQLLIGLLEVGAFISRLYIKLPTTINPPSIVAFDWKAVKTVAPFSLSIAYTAAIWVLITQTDKLILSGILTLEEFGYFSLVALVAGGITILSGPISQAIIPRMTILLAQDKKKEMLGIYRRASQIITLISFSVAIVIGLYAELLIYAWTGNHKAATWGEKVLVWFALGNGVLAIGAFQYYMQSAFGQLKLHVIGSTISAITQVPIIYWAAINYGAIGAGVAWFSFRVIWFLWWTSIVHNRFAPGFHWSWLLKDILPILIVTTSVSLIINQSFHIDLDQSRLILLFKILLIYIATLTSTYLLTRSIIFNHKELKQNSLTKYFPKN